MAQVSKAKHNYYYEGKRIKMNIQTRKDDDTITTCVLKYKLKTQTTNTIIVPNSGVKLSASHYTSVQGNGHRKLSRLFHSESNHNI